MANAIETGFSNVIEASREDQLIEQVGLLVTAVDELQLLYGPLGSGDEDTIRRNSLEAYNKIYGFAESWLAEAENDNTSLGPTLLFNLYAALHLAMTVQVQVAFALDDGALGSEVYSENLLETGRILQNAEYHLANAHGVNIEVVFTTAKVRNIDGYEVSRPAYRVNYSADYDGVSREDLDQAFDYLLSSPGKTLARYATTDGADRLPREQLYIYPAETPREAYRLQVWENLIDELRASEPSFSSNSESYRNWTAAVINLLMNEQLMRQSGANEFSADIIAAGFRFVNLSYGIERSGDRDANEIGGSQYIDLLAGLAGDDVIYGFGGNDVLYGRGGNETLYGAEGDGDDYLNGGLGADLLRGGTGDDTLAGGMYNDTLFGGEGDDRIYGGEAQLLDPDNPYVTLGSDSIFGDDGNDIIYLDSPFVSGYYMWEGNDWADGGAGDDTIHGGVEADTIYGGLGNDTIFGERGADWIDGGHDDDEILGGSGNDTLNGDDGDDRIFGDQGDFYTEDQIFTTPNKDVDPVTHDDLIDGGDGEDLLSGQTGNDTLLGKDGADSLYGGVGNDQLDGGADNDTLSGHEGNDTLEGQTGNDRLKGGEGADQLDGGEGDDLLQGGDDNDYLVGGIDNDTLEGNEGNDTLEGQTGNDSLIGGAGSDVLNGGSGVDILFGEAGADNLDGGGDNDKLIGGAGADYLFGDSGADILWGEDDDDTLDGGEGNDELNGMDGSDSIDGGGGIDNLSGGSGNDTLNGGAGTDTLDGGLDNDYLIGGDDADQLNGDNGFDTLEGGNGADLLAGGSENDVLDGQSGNDSLFGETGSDALYGGSGEDSLEGGAGNDLLLGEGDADQIYGGLGADTVSGGDGDDFIYGEYNDFEITDGTGDSLAGGAGDDYISGEAGNDTLDGGDGNDSILGGAGDDLFVASDGRDLLLGFEGNDTLEGGLGVDTLRGGFGDDTVRGGAGDDFLQGDNKSSFDDEGGDDLIEGGSGNDFLFGDFGADTLSGGADNDTLDGGIGIDALNGDAGNDRFVISGTTEALFADHMDGGTGTDAIDLRGLELSYNIVVTNAAAGTGRIDITAEGGAVTSQTFESIEVFLEAGDVDAAGDLPVADLDFTKINIVNATTVSGNVLDNDTDPYAAAGDTLAVTGARTGKEFDDLSLTSLTTTLTLQGTYGSLLLNSNGTYTYTVDPNDPDTIAIEYPVWDTFVYQVSDQGGLSDTSEVAINLKRSADAPFVEFGGGSASGVALPLVVIQETDDIEGVAELPQADTPDEATGVEQAVVVPDAGAAPPQAPEDVVEQQGADAIATRVDGTEAAENVNGTDATERVYAGDGDDWITPGAGSDTINGGDGRDMLSFVNLLDTAGRTNTQYRLDLDLSTGRATTSGDDVYQISNVERVTGSIFADRIKGDANANELRGLGDYDWFTATTGADTIDGGTGQDMISYVDWLNDADNTADPFNDGGAPPANDEVTGVVVDLNDTTNNTNLAAGHTYIDVERITGSGRQDVFYGDDSSNDFRGLGDYDWFVSSTGGRERYFGGDGIDTVTYYNATEGVIAGLSNGARVGGEETGRGVAGVAALDLFFSIEGLVGGNFDDTLSGSAGRNNLSGLDGDDFIYGYAGIDLLKGGLGNDLIDGGAGSDYALYDGQMADYTLVKTSSSRVTISGAEGTDSLVDVEYFRFTDGDVTIWELTV